MLKKELAKKLAVLGLTAATVASMGSVSLAAPMGGPSGGPSDGSSGAPAPTEMSSDSSFEDRNPGSGPADDGNGSREQSNSGESRDGQAPSDPRPVDSNGRAINEDGSYVADEDLPDPSQAGPQQMGNREEGRPEMDEMHEQTGENGFNRGRDMRSIGEGWTVGENGTVAPPDPRPVDENGRAIDENGNYITPDDIDNAQETDTDDSEA